MTWLQLLLFIPLYLLTGDLYARYWLKKRKASGNEISKKHARAFVMDMWLFGPIYLALFLLRAIFDGVYGLLHHDSPTEKPKVRIDQELVAEAETEEQRIRQEVEQKRLELGELQEKLEEIETKKGPYGRKA
jgi:hypothetical protein